MTAFEQQADGTGYPEARTDPGAAEVVGHMNPILAERVAKVRNEDFYGEADRDRRSAQVRAADHDGGILAKVRRFFER